MLAKTHKRKHNTINRSCYTATDNVLLTRGYYIKQAIKIQKLRSTGGGTKEEIQNGRGTMGHTVVDKTANCIH